MKRRKVPKDKKSKIPKKYLSGLSGSKRANRISLLKLMSDKYKRGEVIPASFFKRRVK